VVPAAALAVLTLCFYLARQRRPYQRFSRATAPHLDRSDVIPALKRAIRQAGGTDVWITSVAAQHGRGLQSARKAFEVWVSSAGYDRVLESVESQAKRMQLGLAIDRLAHSGALRTDRVQLAFQGRPLLDFQVDEIRRMMRVAIIVDDLGQNLAAAQALSRMRSAITFSVMPHLRYSRQTANTAHDTGKEVMLHLPMQPIHDSAPDISQGELRVGMRRAEVSHIVEDDLSTVPFVTGVNNHMGSRATTDISLMKDLMGVLAARHLYFIDSRTIPQSVAIRVARQSQVLSFSRSVFLDDTRTVPYTLNQLEKLSRIAVTTGSALAIGHPYPTTIEALAQFLPKLQSRGIQLVPASRLVR
jgi:uncharacterized protein